MNDSKKKPVKLPPSRKALRKNAEGHFVVDSHEILDGAVKVIRTSKSGAFWSMSYWIKGEGKYFRQSLRTKNLEEAKELAREKYFNLMGDIRAGNKIFSKTSTELIEAYINHKRDEANSGLITHGRVETIRISLNKWFLSFVGKNKKLDKISRHDYETYYVWRRKQSPEVRNATLINERALISSLYKFGMARGWFKYDQAPIFPRMNIKKSQVERRDELNLKEWERMYRSFPRWIKKADNAQDADNRKFVRDFIILSANTGLRFGEMRKLKWQMIVLHREKTSSSKDNEWSCEISVPPDTKTGARNVSGRRGDIFERIKGYSKFKKSNDYVFVNNDNGEQLHKKVYYKLWHSLVKECELDSSTKNLSFYSLRHTYITFRLLAGVNAFMLAKNTGTSIKMIENHYEHIKSSSMRRELTKDMRHDEAGQILLGD